jgi:hypothetical protein
MQVLRRDEASSEHQPDTVVVARIRWVELGLWPGTKRERTATTDYEADQAATPARGQQRAR